MKDLLFTYKLVTIFLLWVPELVAQEYRREIYEPVQLLNAGFEEEIRGHWMVDKAVVDHRVRRTGRSSLKLENHNPANYELIRQKISVAPGEILRFGGWVKGEHISTKELWREKGAGVFIQGYSADGKYVAGEFPPTISGTFDWQEIQGIYKVPAGVSYIYFGLFIRNKSTGTAWFDDLWLEKKQEEGMVSVLKYPNYRGTALSGSHEPWVVTVDLKAVKKAYVHTEIRNRKGKLAYSDSIVLDAGGQHAITWKPQKRLSVGKYNWHFKLFDQDGRPFQEFSYEVSVQRKMPEVYIDQEGFTVKNGKRFFPIGIYLGEGPKTGSWASSEQNLDRISNAGFNTVLSYFFGDQDAAPEYFKLTKAKKLEVVYNLKDIYDGGQNFRRVGSSAAKVSESIIEKFKKETNLLAWYINDELGLGKFPAIQERYKQIKLLDPGHPAFQVNDKVDLLPFFYNSYDIIGTDPYPVENQQTLIRVSDWTKEAMTASKGTKGVWQVLQLHDVSFHNNKPNRPPSLEEMRNMSYQALIGGAKGLFYFAYHWLFYQRDNSGKAHYSEDAFKERWPDIQKLIAEVKGVVPAVVENQRVELEGEGEGVVFSAWDFGQQTYILIANPHNQQKSLSIYLPEPASIEKNTVSFSKISQKNGSIDLSIGALGSGILVINTEE